VIRTISSSVATRSRRPLSVFPLPEVSRFSASERRRSSTSLLLVLGRTDVSAEAQPLSAESWESHTLEHPFSVFPPERFHRHFLRLQVVRFSPFGHRTTISRETPTGYGPGLPLLYTRVRHRIPVWFPRQPCALFTPPTGGRGLNLHLAGEICISLSP
jgi:hypothetical protein